MKEFNRSSIFTGALLVLVLLALLPGRSVLAVEWNEITQRDARMIVVKQYHHDPFYVSL